MFKLPYGIKMHPFLRILRRYGFKRWYFRFIWRKKMIRTFGKNWKKEYLNSKCGINPDEVEANNKNHSPFPLMNYKKYVEVYYDRKNK